MNHWLFQGNPDQFDIDTYLKKAERVYWSVSVKKYQNEISLGDTVYLWRAQGKKKAISGIVAKTTVIEACKPKEELDNPTWLYDGLWSPDSKEKSEYKVALLVEDFRLKPDDSMITSREFMSDPVLRESNIIKVRVGSNFPLKDEEVKRIESLWDFESHLEFDDHEAQEGKVLYRVHRIRERDPSLRKEFISQFLKTHKRLSCELCGLDPEKTYSSIGKNILEVHHTIPLHRLPEGVITTLSDLMLVCPSCHRALHKGDAEDNLESLKKMFQVQSGSYQ